MGKLIAVALAGAALFFVVQSRGANAAKVTSCLDHAGALVRQSTFLEDHLSTTSARVENSQLHERLHKADRSLWDVQLRGDRGLLMKLEPGHSVKDVRKRVAGTIQGSGRIVMLWYTHPSDASRSALERCLP
jgi:hypothetical protein